MREPRLCNSLHTHVNYLQEIVYANNTYPAWKKKKKGQLKWLVGHVRDEIVGCMHQNI